MLELEFEKKTPLTSPLIQINHQLTEFLGRGFYAYHKPTGKVMLLISNTYDYFFGYIIVN